tara:strand:+ start:312 stop:521 length:210 start_codon:yes stop_codon:yes gene_type:complete
MKNYLLDSTKDYNEKSEKWDRLSIKQKEQLMGYDRGCRCGQCDCNPCQCEDWILKGDYHSSKDDNVSPI